MAKRKKSRLLRYLFTGLSASGVAGTLAWAGLVRGQEVPDDTGVTRTYLNKPLIHLPIEIDGSYRSQIANLVLFAKEGANGQWSQCDKAAPMQTSFTFRAPRDGEYWFRIVAIDKQGQMHPDDLAKDPQDAVVVMVDTVPPTLDIAYQGNAPEGQIIHCDVRDANPDIFKMRFYYQTRDQVWRNLDALPNQPNVYCVPAQAALSNFIRVIAVDLAGNTVARTVSLSELATNAAKTPRPANAPAPLPQSVAQQSQTPIAPSPTSAPTNVLQPGPAPSVDIAAAPITPPPVAATPAPPPLLEPREPATRPSLDTTNALPPRINPTPPPIVTNGPILEAPPRPQTVAAPVAPATPPQTVVVNGPAREIETTSGTLSSQQTPTTNRLQIVGSTQVFLNYAVENVGASGVGKMEIYATRDRGQTWSRVAEDTQRKNPAEVHLPGDGVFGLKLVAANGRGFGAEPPQAGDPADWWVEVDTTNPRASITGVRAGTGVESGSMHVFWQAEDKNLADSAVDLFWAPQRDGPWSPIAKSLKNTGQHRWTPPADAGSQAFIRMLVRDKAGNTGLSETTQPVPLDDQSRPRVRVLGLTAVAAPSPTIIPVQSTSSTVDVPQSRIQPAVHTTTTGPDLR